MTGCGLDGSDVKTSDMRVSNPDQPCRQLHFAISRQIGRNSWFVFVGTVKVSRKATLLMKHSHEYYGEMGKLCCEYHG